MLPRRRPVRCTSPSRARSIWTSRVPSTSTPLLGRCSGRLRQAADDQDLPEMPSFPRARARSTSRSSTSSPCASKQSTLPCLSPLPEPFLRSAPASLSHRAAAADDPCGPTERSSSSPSSDPLGPVPQIAGPPCKRRRRCPRVAAVMTSNQAALDLLRPPNHQIRFAPPRSAIHRRPRRQDPPSSSTSPWVCFCFCSSETSSSSSPARLARVLTGSASVPTSKPGRYLLQAQPPL